MTNMVMEVVLGTSLVALAIALAASTGALAPSPGSGPVPVPVSDRPAVAQVRPRRAGCPGRGGLGGSPPSKVGHGGAAAPAPPSQRHASFTTARLWSVQD
ncbi:MAG: hypothetical protein ABSG81_13625 [Acidimicrobiales bacterium]